MSSTVYVGLNRGNIDENHKLLGSLSFLELSFLRQSGFAYQNVKNVWRKKTP